jgi:lipopolysaccharide/colanic/teichoic acid biosynthesis glycosyltransferase
VNYFFYKRFFDIFLSLFLILTLSPIFILIISSYFFFFIGKPFYISNRVGYQGKLFRIYKFRTMVLNAENIGSVVTSLNDRRNIIFGRFLRRTKLDELPQLFNILEGSMSFVGPRPNFKKLVKKYPKSIKKVIYRLKPGLTDFSTLLFTDMDSVVSKKNSEKKYLFYVQPIKNFLIYNYYNKINFITDIKILFFTFFSLLNIIRFNKKMLYKVFKIKC